MNKREVVLLPFIVPSAVKFHSLWLFVNILDPLINCKYTRNLFFCKVRVSHHFKGQLSNLTCRHPEGLKPENKTTCLCISHS